MTNTLTSDIGATVEQCKRIIDAGADCVRITIPSVADAQHLRMIKEKLRALGYTAPLIADVHFNADIAFKTAEITDKVRINPGNFGISGRTKKIEYTADEYKLELEEQRRTFSDLLDLCQRSHTAVRIGVNHGSLADRIMSRYGDTPEGMVESALEFLRVCREKAFMNVMVSLKSSNIRVMVLANRLLVKKMQDENMHYPIHLGVTEAGEGEDGRIKSAIGIGSLLAEGIGDTIRVSLTEEPEKEIPVAQKLVYSCNEMHRGIPESGLKKEIIAGQTEFNRRVGRNIANTGGNEVPVVITDITGMISGNGKAEIFKNTNLWDKKEDSSDYFFSEKWDETFRIPLGKGIILPAKTWIKIPKNRQIFPLLTAVDISVPREHLSDRVFLQLKLQDLTQETVAFIKSGVNLVIVAAAESNRAFYEFREFFNRLAHLGIDAPVILKVTFTDKEKEYFQLKSAVLLGGLLLDGLGDGIWLSADEGIGMADVESTAFAILQATRTRISRTEYIACPSCGRTHFNLMDILAGIKARTSHLKGLKIGVMGCIVNGPGEMADADYGYVGSGKGRVTLYKGKEVIRRNIKEASAIDELISLIREHGDWKEPGEQED